MAASCAVGACQETPGPLDLAGNCLAWLRLLDNKQAPHCFPLALGKQFAAAGLAVFTIMSTVHLPFVHTSVLPEGPPFLGQTLESGHLGSVWSPSPRLLSLG